MMGRAPATALPDARPTSATKAATAATVFALLLAFATSSRVVFQGTGSFQPRFTDDIVNLTVAVGRDAIFHCLVAHLGGYRVGWVKTETKAIQAIHDHVITHNPRVAVSHTDNSIWNLHIRRVQEEDAGQYMCQINTDPMTAQIGVLNVVVPPDFIPGETSGDVMVPELGMVKLTCKARGNPPPRIHWRREDGDDIVVRDGNHKTRVSIYPGENLKLPKVTRADMGAYMCIATNGVPPTISKRIIVNVHFFPVIHVRNQLVGAPLGTDVTLECVVEASPRSINFWMKGTGHRLISRPTPSSLGIVGDMVISSPKYDVQVSTLHLFKVKMTVTIRNLQKDDMGSYRCIAKNSLGEVESSIRLYEIPGPTRLYNMPFDEEDYGEQFGSAERDQDDELFNGVAERGGRPHMRMTLRPPRATYDTLSENHVPFGLAPSCTTVTAATAAATTLPLLALVLFVI